MEKHVTSPDPLYIVSRENSYVRGCQEKLLCKRASWLIILYKGHPDLMQYLLHATVPFTNEFDAFSGPKVAVPSYVRVCENFMKINLYKGL